MTSITAVMGRLPWCHILRCFTRCFSATFSNQFISNFQIPLGLVLLQPYYSLPLELPIMSGFFFEKGLIQLVSPFSKKKCGAKKAPHCKKILTLMCLRVLYPNLHLMFVHLPRMEQLYQQSLFETAILQQRTHSHQKQLAKISSQQPCTL